MPRKTGGRGRGMDRADQGFNEAAARCRGKPSGAPASKGTPDGASMRPRPDAAENPLADARIPNLAAGLQ